jgi:hypothetical protein
MEADLFDEEELAHRKIAREKVMQAHLRDALVRVLRDGRLGRGRILRRLLGHNKSKRIVSTCHMAIADAALCPRN